MLKHLSFPVDALNCASCAVRAETALNTVEGVETAQVNFATGLADITFNAPLDASALRDALENAGKPAQIANTRLQINGMTCASCVGRVEAELLKTTGVLSANVNLATGLADVESLGTPLPDLISAVKEAGKTAQLLTPTLVNAPTLDPSQKMRTTFLWAAALSAPVFILEMGGHAFPAFHHLIARTIGMQASWALQFVLTALVLAGPGRTLWRDGVFSLIKRRPDMNALVVLGSGAAFFYSCIALFAPMLLPQSARSVYFEAAAVIVTLILAGRWMEARAKGRTGSAIARLIALRPSHALVERDGKRQDIALDALALGDIIHLRPGERVAVDGVVLSGDSWIDESMLTGEPVPVQKNEGSKITAGTVNGTGTLSFRAVAVGADTVLSQIIEMVQRAQGARLPVQDLVNQITAWFVPAVLAIAALTVSIWLIFGPDPALTNALVAGVAVLIIACPCAMGLATPTSIMVGTGRAADLGVLFAKGAALQTLQSVTTVAFDKTGTLTEGRPVLTKIHLFGSLSEDQALALAAAGEVSSEHPIARALTHAAGQRDILLPALDHFESITGGGIMAQIGGQDILLGNARLLQDHTVPLESMKDSDFIGTEVLLAVDAQLVARFEISDPIKQSAKSAVAALTSMHIKTVMITGDTRAAATSVAAQLGIDHVIAEVLPGAKAETVAKLQSDGPVAFVGDGINDAPAMARADIGIAIGTGTDVAIEAADVVLLSGNLDAVGTAFSISTATLRNIRQNLFWAFAYNALLIPIAAGALYPSLGILLSPALAAGAMAFSSVFVITNALRLRRINTISMA